MALTGFMRRVIDRLRWRRYEEELREDVAFHLDMSAAAFRAAGHSPDEANRLARVKFGGVDRMEEAVRDVAGSRRLLDLGADVRYALRMIARAPAFSAIVIKSLGLGIGAAAAMFGIIDAVLLRPLPYPNADQLVQVLYLNEADGEESTLSQVDVQEILAGTRTFAAAGPVFPEQAGFSVVGSDGAVQVRGSWVTPGALQALGVAPLLGPGVQPGDDVPGAPPVVLLSAPYWRDRYGSSPDVVGQTMRVQGESRTIVGVMPPDFRLPGYSEEDLWLVPQMEPRTVRAPFYLRLFARIVDGRSLEDAQADLAPVSRAVAAAYPSAEAAWHYVARPMKDRVIRESGATLWMLAGAVGLVMLIAVANVATLLLVRTTTREPELGVRVALGAGRGRIARQLLAESTLLAVAGGLAAVIVAVGLLALVGRLDSRLLPRLHEVHMTGRVVLVAAVLSLLAALVTGVAALMRPFRGVTWLRQSAGSSDRGSVGRLREAFVVVEFALALTVLVGAVLLVTSLRRLEAVNPGTDVRELLAVRLSLPEADYPDEERTFAFYQELEARLEQHPRVEAAAVSMALPPDRLVMRNPARAAGATTGPGEDLPLAEQLYVTPDYFRVLGIALRAGRDFAETDRSETPLVAIVNEELARRFFPGRSALGERLQLGGPSSDAPAYEIIGIVADVKYQGLDAAPEPTVYASYAQSSWWRSMYVVLRTTGDPLALVPDVRAAVAALDPRIPLQEITTMDALLQASVGAPRLNSRLLLGFAAVATLLAMTGIYGVISYAITQRLREMSIRMALGARAVDVLGLVMRSALRMAVIGAVLGVVAALLLSGTLERFVFGIEPTDVRTLLVSVALLLLAAFVAALGPAIRAARAQPAQALRAS